MTKTKKSINYKISIPKDKDLYLSYIHKMICDTCKNWDSKSFSESELEYIFYMDLKEIDRLYTLNISLEDIGHVIESALNESGFYPTDISIDFK